ncbi:patatin-like phospholipase family protein [Paraburkholderia lycopersici]|uniref:NTE family protein n=1 Tax=Paraburkholderia lycopersici TaxID=416944 RepID=A0A1G6RGF9_9BURK|nr:patatin-like phospholipase family protein [Paraburkholderia lycopersici]SDD03648.1 NTE family protein [Paraburkholderia lycopersici]
MPAEPETSSRAARAEPLLVDLALQGGGSHGAYTWGVLDRLLEEPWLQIEGISGTSAGAMNAAVLASGYAGSGVAGAREALARFWRRVADGARFSPFRRGPIDILLGRWTLDHSPIFVALDMMARVVSPYDLNPASVNPLRSILVDTIDFDALRNSRIKLFVTATRVANGQARVFRNADLTPDALLASACLPTLFQAVEIDGEAYWDGGYVGNPTISPLVRETDSIDTILVQVNPVERAGTPRSARDIVNRVNEIAFNSPLIKELRMMALLHKVADAGSEEGRRWAHMRLHRVHSAKLATLGSSSKLNAEWSFITMLRDEGRLVAEAFLARHGAQLGVASTFDFEALLEGVLK